MENHYSFGHVHPFCDQVICCILQEPARPLLSDDQKPLYVLSIQERAEQLTSQFENKQDRPQVKFPF